MSACSSSPAASDDETDDEMPTSSVAELTIAPNEQPGETNAAADATNSNVVPNANTNTAVQDEDQQRRSKTHSNLCAYELKRRTAYESKLLSSSLYWHAFRTLLHDSLLETQKADMLVRGWTHASKQYGVSMASVGEWCIDDKGAPVVDVKKKKKLFEQAAAAQTANNNDVGGGATAGGLAGGSEGGGVSVSVGSSSMLLFPAQHQRKGSTAQHTAAAEFYREERCGSMIKTLAESAGTVAGRFEEMTGYMHDEVLPELASLSDHLKSEVMFMEKLGDSIMNELEAAEEEVCKSWELYYNATVSSNDTTSAECTNHQPPNPPDASLPIINTPSKDVWVSEMRYRMAVAFLSSVWEKCSSELSKLFLSMKDAECRRRKRMKEILLRAAQRQEHLWLGLPSVINPFLKELTEWPMERRAVEEDVQSSIRDRAQAIQLEDAERKKNPEGDDDVEPRPGLGGEHSSGDGDFELSSPLVSDLMIKAKVVEKRTPGLMASWKVSLAVVTSDAHLQLFELPPGSKLHTGSAPEVAFQNLIPPVVVPSMEGVVKGGGAKFPSSKYWFDHLVPSESFALSNCVVALNGDDKDGKASNSFEVVETILTSGASKMFTKTMNRKMQFRAITGDEAKDFVAALKDSV